MKDEEILAKISKGDESALDYLYKKYYRMMVNMVMRNSGTEDEAKDVYQDSLIVFWQKVVSGNLTLTSRISTYLYSICQNLWRKELERKSRLSSEVVEETVTPDFDKQERIKIIRDCINDLNDTCRRILTYHYFDRMNMKDIADKLGFANADTAKTKKYKCKKELDKLVKTIYSESDFLD